MGGYYILKDRKAVPVASVEEWARAFETMDRHVANDMIGGARISTVFLGLDHSHGMGGPPLLFETMIFGGAHNGYQTRCSTWEEAEAQHTEALKLVRSGLN